MGVGVGGCEARGGGGDGENKSLALTHHPGSCPTWQKQRAGVRGLPTSGHYELTQDTELPGMYTGWHLSGAEWEWPGTSCFKQAPTIKTFRFTHKKR